ncbi:MAG TPA: glycosyltransferase 87 family protein [Gaiellaceae bacterium]|nr:glycosyltransferase 87 family protein [Gaiellaceae bacterium]
MTASAAREPVRRLVVPALVACFAASALPLALAGPRFVPAAAHAQPEWLLGPYGDGLGLRGPWFFVCLLLAFVAYLGLVALADRIPARVLWSVVAGAVTLFLLAPPLLSQDVFSYIAYARLGARHGLDPYVVVPAAIPHDAVLPFVGWREAVSAYGPLFTLATYPLGLLSVAAALWLLKCVAALSVVGIAAIAARAAARRGADPSRAAALIALNPVVLVDVIGGGHNDALTVLLMTAALATLGRNEIAAGASVVGSAALKASALVAAPFALLAARGRRKLVAAELGALALAAGVSFAAFGVTPLDAIGVVGFDQSLTSRHSVPSTLARMVGLGVSPVRVALELAYVVLVVVLLVRTARGGDWIRAAGWAALGLLLATSWLMPWYVLWVLPFAAVAGDGPLSLAVLALCAFQLASRVPL